MRGRFGLYVTTLVAYLLIDAVWLTLTGTSVYRATLGDILLVGFKPIPALAVYLVQVLGLMVFVMPRVRASGGVAAALAYGAAFGVFTYALYDLTNLATVKHWTVSLAVTDIVWGGVVSGLASAIGWSIAGRFTRQRIFT